MGHVKLILIAASISILYLNCKKINDCSPNFRSAQDAITIHKFWELDTIKVIKPALYGMDSTLIVLDFRDKERMRFKGPKNTLSRFLNYTITDSLIIILDEKRRPIKEKNKTNYSGPGILKITALTNDTMVLRARVDMGGKKSVNV